MAESPVNHGNTAPNSTADSGAANPSYVAFVLVPIFFFLGLLGVLICHILKKKGYHCTTESEEEEGLEDEKDPEAGDLDSDTVNQIVHCIMKNEANSDALKAMVRENSLDSDGGVQPRSQTAASQNPISAEPWERQGKQWT
ncbi:hypothetical protein SKAU_G00030460 [Synaphobranchus kaupii]|uniref:RELT-like protein 1 n=1 Tax=Synaphobranchus kaupii TaxID=118154 RepID=A0A9Q1GEL7_SYNKA|nr:hypothetical protein SKAU_G00030460 [Synaphobranchus kaupii]